MALRLVASGFVVAVPAIVLTATGVHARVGPVSLLALVALAGFLTVAAAGVLAISAIRRRGERSVLVFATLPISAFALLVVLAQIVFDVP